jgi:hypothetical protein
MVDFGNLEADPGPVFDAAISTDGDQAQVAGTIQVAFAAPSLGSRAVSEVIQNTHAVSAKHFICSNPACEGQVFETRGELKYAKSV